MSGLRAIPFALILLFIAVLVPGRARADHSPLSDETRRCLECHGKQGIVKFFPNNESLEAFVDPDKFQASVHKTLTCSNCHADFSNGKHPARTYKTRLQYQIKASFVCRQCHTDGQLKKDAVHRGLFQKEQSGKPILCANCHGSHAIMRVSGKSAFTNEEQYCMKCHEHSVHMRFTNGEGLQLKVDTLLLKISVHTKLSCSDCHYGFSSEDHPRRLFRTARDYTLAASESCRRCHFDKYTKTLESIHYALLSQGNLEAPVCVDCHGSHEILHVSRERAVSAKRCQRCHAKIYDTFAKSVHGSALFNEHNQDVPVCVDCHTAHTIQDPFSLDFREKIPAMCSNCHGDKEIVGKYGLSTDVVKTYLTDFHGVTLELYKRQRGGVYKPGKTIAVCTDCHGTHNITTMTGPKTAIVKANLLKRCQKCHKNAGENFPDAWLSHYEPSLTRTPLVYLAGAIYKVFIPLLVIGLVLQILLHIWRYAVNR